MILALVINSILTLPAVGAPLPNADLVDAWDRQSGLGARVDIPVLVIYEDKDSAKLNDSFKQELARLARDGQYQKRVALIAVADVADYDYFPVRLFVKSAIKNETEKQKTVIYCDWNGKLRDTLNLQSHTSNVVLYDRQGHVVFASAGALSAEERAKVIDLLRQLTS